MKKTPPFPEYLRATFSEIIKSAEEVETMSEEERVEAKASHYGMVWKCSVCGCESDCLLCPKCCERKDLEEKEKCKEAAEQWIGFQEGLRLSSGAVVCGEAEAARLDRRLAELRDREACGYDGDVPYFEVKREPLYSYKIDQATWNSEEISIKNMHPLFLSVRKMLENYGENPYLDAATKKSLSHPMGCEGRKR